MLWIIYGISIAFLYWVYDGYGRFLTVAVALKRLLSSAQPPRAFADDAWPDLTVLLTVHNEEATLPQRIADLLNTDYPADRVRILIASDGSTDRTNDIAGSFAAADSRVQVMHSPGLGKTATQNLALQQIGTEIVVFTDADIRFDRSFLRNAVARFADPDVGAVDGRLTYGHGAAGDALAQGQGYYWRYEHRVRQRESELGILAVVAGACFAVRRRLVRPMDPSIGEDCIVPLDVVEQGARVVHEPSAIAMDSFDEGSEFAFRRRIRMTLRNWQGTWTRPRLLNPVLHPGYAFALWSHKLLRWLSPVFVAGALTSSLLLVLTAPSWLTGIALAPLLALFLLAGAGVLGPRIGIRIPGSGTAFSFVLANGAFLVGVFRAVTGQRVHRYQRA